MNAKSDADRFGVALTRLFASRGGRVPSVIDGEVYFEALQEFAIESVEAVMRAAEQQGGDFVPSAGDLRAAARKAPAAPYHQRFLPPAEWKRDPAWDKPEVREELAQLKASLRERDVLSVTLGIAERAMAGGKEGNS